MYINDFNRHTSNVDIYIYFCINYINLKITKTSLLAAGSSLSTGLGVHTPQGWPGRTCQAQDASWDVYTQTHPYISVSCNV